MFCFILPNWIFWVGHPVSCCPTKYFELDNVFHITQLNFLSWAPCFMMPNGIFWFGHHVSCCPTEYFELGTVFHVAQLNILSWAPCFMLPNWIFWVGHRVSCCPTNYFELGTVYHVAQLNSLSFPPLLMVPNNWEIFGITLSFSLCLKKLELENKKLSRQPWVPLALLGLYKLSMKSRYLFCYKLQLRAESTTTVYQNYIA